MGSSCKISAAIIPSRNIHYMYVGSTVHTLLCARVFTLALYGQLDIKCPLKREKFLRTS